MFESLFAKIVMGQMCVWLIFIMGKAVSEGFLKDFSKITVQNVIMVRFKCNVEKWRGDWPSTFVSTLTGWNFITGRGWRPCPVVDLIQNVEDGEIWIARPSYLLMPTLLMSTIGNRGGRCLSASSTKVSDIMFFQNVSCNNKRAFWWSKGMESHCGK